MSHQRTSPYLTHEFWIRLMKIRLADPYISADFRKRCEKILQEEQEEMGKKAKSVSLHYPKERQ